MAESGPVRERHRDIPTDVLDNLLEGCQVISPEFRYLYVNDAVVRHGRRSRELLLGRTMMEAYPGIENTPMFEVLRRCMNARVYGELENRFTFPDGSTGWFELRFEPVPEGVAILSVEVTDRKRTEAALRRTVRALTTLSSCNQTLVRADDEQRFLDEFCCIVVDVAGYGMAWIGLLDSGPGLRIRVAAGAGVNADRRERIQATLRQPDSQSEPARAAIRTGQPVVVLFGESDEHSGTWHREYAGLGLRSCIGLPIRANDACIGALVIGSPDPDAFDADERGVLDEVALDLGHGVETLRARAEQAVTASELEVAREQLALSQRIEAVGRLAGGVAHDFNNLLSVILTYAGFAIERLDPSDPVRADIQEVHDAGQRAAELTRQLLAFSRKQVLQPRPLNLNDRVAAMQSMLSRVLGEDIRIDVRTAADLGSVMADPGQLDQVLMNLAVNARDAMPNGGRLLLETANAELDAEYAAEHVVVEPGSYVMVAVTDTGHGMDAETRSRIFEPFFTTREEGKGTGLGLSTVYGIVKQSGGYIWVYSEIGVGTTFRVYLPRVDRPAVEHRVRRPVIIATGDETILVVEDEDAVRRAAERILRTAGYHVLSAANGDDALRLCEEHEGPIDLLLTDVVMPGLSGRDLSTRVQELKPGLKVMFTSGYTESAIVDHGVLEPGIAFIGKPFAATDLTRRVREVLDD